MKNSLPFVNARAEQGGSVLPPAFPYVERGVEVFHTLGREFDRAVSSVECLLENKA